MATAREAEIGLKAITHIPMSAVEHTIRILRSAGEDLWLRTGSGFRNRLIEPHHLINGMLAVVNREPIKGPQFVKSLRALERSSQKRYEQVIPSARDLPPIDGFMSSLIGLDSQSALDLWGDAFDKFLPASLGKALDMFLKLAVAAIDNGHSFEPDLFSLQIIQGEALSARITVENNGSRREFHYNDPQPRLPDLPSQKEDAPIQEYIISLKFRSFQKLAAIYRPSTADQDGAPTTAPEPASSKAETKRASKRTKAAGPASPTTSNFNQPHAEAARSPIEQLNEGGGGAQRSSVSDLREATFSMKGTDRGPHSSRSNQLSLGGGRLRSRAA